MVGIARCYLDYLVYLSNTKLRYNNRNRNRIYNRLNELFVFYAITSIFANLLLAHDSIDLCQPGLMCIVLLQVGLRELEVPRSSIRFLTLVVAIKGAWSRTGKIVVTYKDVKW
jgi:hypothetical protein